MKNENKEVSTVEENNIVPLTQTGQPDLLAMFVQGGNTDVQTLKELMSLKERNDANEAKKAFTAAINQFRADCPTVTKTKKAHNSKYAGLAESIDQIKDTMSANGLSHRWTTGQRDGTVNVTCIVSHIGGHEESTTLSGEPDTSGSKNSIQAVGSTVSYLQRYTLFAALGLASADEDNDGNAVNLAHVNEAIKKHFFSIYAIKQGIATDDFEPAAEAWFELTDQEKGSLWIAPTKGGIFTADERETIRSKPFRQAFYKDLK